MLTATVTSTIEELQQIVALSDKNMKNNFTDEEQNAQGFLTWKYSLELLHQMHLQHPHIIVKDENKVIAYALVALKDSASFHANIKAMLLQLDGIIYYNKKLAAYKYYVIGQTCIDSDYRGKGVFEMLYFQHKKLFKDYYDCVVTEISTNNKRSLRAHEKAGFKQIHTYKDELDEWVVVVWNWQQGNNYNKVL